MSTHQVSVGYLRRHAGALLGIGGLSAAGIVATSAFHVVTGRGLGPAAFGLLAAFLAIVNIAAIGASSLQNSVAVSTASVSAEGERGGAGFRAGRVMDASTIEALVLGGAVTLATVACAPALADALTTSRLAIYLAAATVLPSFLLSVAQGRLQGSGRILAVATWSTGSQVMRLLLGVAVLAAGLAAVSLLVAVLVSITVVAVGAAYQSRHLLLPASTRAFSGRSGVLILLTLSFAWLTNMEVVLVRIGAPEDVAGTYAAAAVLDKMILLVPTMLSLYLLPRFVARQADGEAARYGVNVVLLTVSAAGLLAVVGTAVVGPLVVRLLFGEGYDLSAELLPWLALAYLPWALVQGVLIRLTANASAPALAVLLVAAGVQAVAIPQVLPDPFNVSVVVGVLGVLVLAFLLLLHLRSSRSLPIAAL